MDFLNALLPPVIITSLAASFFVFYVFRDELKGRFDMVHAERVTKKAAIEDKVGPSCFASPFRCIQSDLFSECSQPLLIKALIVLGGIVLGFLLHPRMCIILWCSFWQMAFFGIPRRRQYLTHVFSVTQMNVAWLAVFGAIILLLLSRPKHVEPALEAVEWSTLIFFAARFVMVRCQVNEQSFADMMVENATTGGS